jgi:hypothetical protein
MRSVAAWPVALGSVLTLLGSAAAAPPEDSAAYCRATNPQMQSQLRCIALEKASQERLVRAQGAIDPQAWARCQGQSGSWTQMEACIAQPESPTAGATPVPGAATPGGVTPGAETANPAAPPGAATPGTATPGASAAVPPAPATGSPSTIILGPQPSAAPTSESERPSRPISEEEADRQVKDVLQREGQPAARCTKKQYGPGWVTVCE